MKPKELLDNKSISWKQEIIGGIPCSVTYFKEFRWSWVACQLNTFIIVGNTDKQIDKTLIEQFSATCLKYALKNHKGWPRGLQSAIGSIAILKGVVITEDAIGYCEKSSKKHWSAFEFPVVFNSEKKEGTRFKKDPIWGAVFMPYFKNMIDQTLKKLKADSSM